MAYQGMGGGSGLRSPREEASFFSLNRAAQNGDSRATLHRRFTTNNIPTLSTPLSPIGQQRRQAAEPTEFTTATYHKLQVLERKRIEHEYLKEAKRRFDAEMELLNLQAQHGEAEPNHFSTEGPYGGPAHSQPATPPEYNEGNGFPSALSRPNRFSMSSINAAMTTRGSRANSQVTSPPSNIQGGNGTNSGFPSQSMPGSRRNSEEDHDDFENDDFTPLSPAAAARKNNRMSMPVTRMDYGNRADLPDLSSVLGHIDTAGYLFGQDDSSSASQDRNGFLQMGNTKDDFPVLVRREGAGNGTKLSASSAALDLALSQSPGPDTQFSGWNGYRHRQAQQSLPANTFRKAPQVDEYDASRSNGNVDVTPKKTLANNRRSVEFSFASPTSAMPKLTQSYSTNDVPTLKNNNGMNGASGIGFTSHAQQHFHNHNASLGRIPQNAMSNRNSRDLSMGSREPEHHAASSGMHTSAAPYGSGVASAAPNGGGMASAGPPAMSQYSNTAATNPGHYGYGMSMLNGAMGSLNLGPGSGPGPQYGGPQYGGPPGYGSNGMYGNAPTYNPYATYGPGGRVQDSQARVIQSRRMQNDANKYMNYDLKTMPRQEIYNLCKDQHGCRFLQKKLEERNTENIQIIFDETAPHVVELMTDPFGNYLCQKLLEFCNDEQRNTLVRNAAPAMVQIAFNQHGTRALQKMIEFISTDEQTQMIIRALSGQVVDLIQDLNGNHVIQKCLNHLKSTDAQFIFDAVGEHCITVGTHRHGCCVLQRCIDHASGFQKVDLIRQITAHSFHLVQDPFGNYVVQYILDLNEASFTTPMCQGFQGKICELSKQKFSSNVIEKCIRCAEPQIKSMMIEELLDVEQLEQLMRDSYGNYVIQTALEFAPAELCIHLIEAMRPILPSIRQTPYGRRIMSKVAERESRLAAYTGRNSSSGQASPGNNAQGTSESAVYGPQYQAPMYTSNANYGPNILSPQPHRQPHRLSNPAPPHHLQNSVHNNGNQGYQHQQGQQQQYGMTQPNGGHGQWF